MWIKYGKKEKKVHWEMYKILESQYYTPEPNITLWVNYTGIIIF